MRYRVDTSRVSHDRLQDEVIVINVASGAYYSGSGTAADVWTLIAQGVSRDEAVRQLASAYATDEKHITADVEACIATLLARGLIEADDHPVNNGTALLPEGMRGAWAPPAFDEYTDMWELIKLDPIHEVDEVGWPVAKA
jgi:hypothetical protein